MAVPMMNTPLLGCMPCGLVEGMYCLTNIKQYLLAALFDPEDGGNTFLQNVSKLYQTTVCHVQEDSAYQC
jgi:hypothetical protein